jgi:hypothetical protein
MLFTLFNVRFLLMQVPLKGECLGQQELIPLRVILPKYKLSFHALLLRQQRYDAYLVASGVGIVGIVLIVLSKRYR